MRARIGLYHFRVIPFRNPAKKNACQRLQVNFSSSGTPGTLYLGTAAPNTVGKCRENREARLLALWIRHRTVGRAKINSSQ